VQLSSLDQPPPAKTLKVIPLICLLAALCLAQAVPAQSGRRTVKKGSPVPEEPAAQTDKPAPRITSLVVCGHDATKGMKEIASTNVSTVVKAFTSQLNARPGLLIGVVNGGKLKREEAVERAKRERGAYVLWFGYSMKMVGLYDETVEHIDYVVLQPETAETVTEGRVYPDRQKTHADPGGIMRLPTSRRRSRPIPFRQLEDGGRQIADLVRNKL
jgi:hypothetical protein